MKKVLFLIPNLRGGGAERVLINLVNNISDSKYEVTVLSLFDEGENKKYLHQNIKYKYIFKKTFRGNSYLLNLFPARILYKMFIKDEYDIEIAYLEQLPTKILAGSTNHKAKKIAWLHTDPKNIYELTKSIKGIRDVKWNYQQYDCIVGVSKTAINSLQQMIGMKEKMCVKYNTIETKTIIAKSNEPIIDIKMDKNKFNIITVGRLTKAKGYDRLLRICKKLKDNNLDYHMYILGKGELESNLQKFITNNNLHNNVTLLGFKENPYKYVKNADVFICSSYQEGFSTAVTEALVVGTPIITTLCSGMDEMLHNSKYGLIVDNDELSLYEGLYKLLSDRNLLEHYRNMAIKRGREFSTESTIKEVEDLLDNL